MSYLENYRKVHQHPMNRACHTIGIPLVVLSLPLLVWRWQWGLCVFVVGWFFQFLGHVFEGKMPAFFSDPLYLFVGPMWWFKKLLGREKK